MTKNETVIGACGPCKAAKRPRYDARDRVDALTAGHRYATAYNVPAIVIPTAYGYSIGHDALRVPVGHPYYVVAVDGTVSKVEYAYGNE